MNERMNESVSRWLGVMFIGLGASQDSAAVGR